jgi:hypothetical protein
MRYLGQYAQLILSLQEMGMEPKEIAEKLKVIFPNDKLGYLTGNKVSNFMSTIDTKRTIGKKLGDLPDNRSKIGPQAMDEYKEFSIRAIIGRMLKEDDAHQKLMEWIVYQEINEDSDAAIERELGWELGTLEQYRDKHNRLYRACVQNHFEKLKRFSTIEIFKTHDALARLCSPAIKEMKSMIEDPDTPKTVKAKLCKDIVDITTSKARMKSVEESGLVELSPEFKAAAEAAKKQERRRKVPDKEVGEAN